MEISRRKLDKQVCSSKARYDLETDTGAHQQVAMGVQELVQSFADGARDTDGHVIFILSSRLWK